ncbi:PA domain-containing protein [Streptomyces sp. FXJ1.4098]|nr:PA domain-containing protein [Streptomyces sp. FXJ1.4098]
MGQWKKHIYAAPTKQVTDGSFEFYSRWRLEKKKLTASVTSPERVTLNPQYANTYTGWPVKITGNRKVRLVDAKGGTAEDFEGLDVKGKAVLVGLAPDGWPDEAVVNATKAGAAYVLVYRKTTAGLWLTAVDSATIPVMSIPGEEGDKLLSLLAAEGRGAVTLDLGGTAVSPYVYDVLLPEPGAIGKDLTYPSTAATPPRSRPLPRLGQGADRRRGHAHLPPYQLFSVESKYDVPLGTRRTEYYSADPTPASGAPPCRTTTAPAAVGALVTYRPGTEQTVDWLSPVFRRRPPPSSASHSARAMNSPSPSPSTPTPAAVTTARRARPRTTWTRSRRVCTRTASWSARPVRLRHLPGARRQGRVQADDRRRAHGGLGGVLDEDQHPMGLHLRQDGRGEGPPLLSVDYDLALDLFGRTKAGRQFSFQLARATRKARRSRRSRRSRSGCPTTTARPGRRPG